MTATTRASKKPRIEEAAEPTKEAIAKPKAAAKEKAVKKDAPAADGKGKKLKVGDSIPPALELPDHEGNAVNLVQVAAAHAGVVVFFYVSNASYS